MILPASESSTDLGAPEPPPLLNSGGLLPKNTPRGYMSPAPSPATAPPVRLRVPLWARMRRASPRQNRQNPRGRAVCRRGYVRRREIARVLVERARAEAWGRARVHTIR